jgi:hypothetical protein
MWSVAAEAVCGCGVVDDGCAQVEELHRVRKRLYGLDVLCIRWDYQEHVRFGTNV